MHRILYSGQRKLDLLLEQLTNPIICCALFIFEPVLSDVILVWGKSVRLECAIR